jgi:two-component system chemotaxis sensor kinase CheA
VDQISATIDKLRQAVAGYRESADGRRSRQVVDSLFRTVHSFKAAAAAEGLGDLSRTAHEFEDLLHSVRTGQVTVDAEVLRVFDETVVALRSGTEAAVLNRFNETVRRAPTSDGELPSEFSNLKENERHRALTALREGANLYVMEVVFEVSDFDERFRKLKKQLEEIAELISVSPTMHNDQVSFKVVYASQSEKIPVQTAVRQAIRAGQAAATSLGKQIEFVVKGEELLLEKNVSDAVTDALLHLVRNAVDHGIETTGTVLIEASAGQISVSDDGRGIDPENLSLIFQPGFSTATNVTEVSGRGVGLDAVKTAVEALGGNVSVTSEPGKGSSFQIKIPNPTKTPNQSSDA